MLVKIPHFRPAVEYDRLCRVRGPCNGVAVGDEPVSGEGIPRAYLTDPFLIATIDLIGGQKVFQALRGAVDYVEREPVPNRPVVAVTPPHDG